MAATFGQFRANFRFSGALFAIANSGTCKAYDSRCLLTKAVFNHLYLVTCYQTNLVSVCIGSLANKKFAKGW